MKYVPVKLTQPVHDGQDPPDLGWRSLGPIQIVNVGSNGTGRVAMELECRNVRVMLVCEQDGSDVTIYRNNTELVEIS